MANDETSTSGDAANNNDGGDNIVTNQGDGTNQGPQAGPQQPPVIPQPDNNPVADALEAQLVMAEADRVEDILVKENARIAALGDAATPFDRLAASIGGPAFIAQIKSQITEKARIVYRADDELPTGDSLMPVEIIQAIILDAVNGKGVLPEQSVAVVWIKEENQLVIPKALGMNITGQAVDREFTSVNDVLASRYHKIGTQTYQQLYDILQKARTAAEVRKSIDDLNMPAARGRVITWEDPTWYSRSDIGLDPKSELTMFRLSVICQFNCDVRDAGFLYRPDATLGDGEWIRAHEEPLTRLDDKLHSFTLRTIAALNYPALKNSAIGAWTRAYGLSMGILPSLGSRCRVEYRFTSAMPEDAHMAEITKKSDELKQKLFPLCANLLAMFGVFHLNKDHTYKEGDPNLSRNGTSFLNTLRTLVDVAVYDKFETEKEVLVRTTQHPFGLAQTYWLMRIMHRYNMLALPLKIRINNSPPPVQRLMIAKAAMGEWTGIPVGKTLIGMYYSEYEVIQRYVDTVEETPPAYSDLYRYYGYATKQVIPENVMNAVKAVMPAIYGYVMAVHVTNETEKDGLGYALSLANVKKESQGQAKAWAASWARYMGQIEDLPLEEFARINYERAPGAFPALEGGGAPQITAG